MAIALDAASSASTAWLTNKTTYSWNHTCTGSDLALIVGVFCNNNPTRTVSGVTYNGTAMTRLGYINDYASGYDRLELWGLLGPSTGTHAVEVTLSGQAAYNMAGAVSYTGVSQTGLPDSANTARTTTNATSLQISTTTVADNCWLVGTYRNGAGAAITYTNCTLRAGVVADGVTVVDSNGAKTPAGSFSITEAISSSTSWEAVLVSLAPAGASSSSIKTVNGLAKASVKTVNGLAIASVKTWNGLA